MTRMFPSVQTVGISSASGTVVTTAASVGLSCARNVWSSLACPWQVGDVAVGPGPQSLLGLVSVARPLGPLV